MVNPEGHCKLESWIPFLSYMLLVPLIYTPFPQRISKSINFILMGCQNTTQSASAHVFQLKRETGTTSKSELSVMDTSVALMTLQLVND